MTLAPRWRSGRACCVFFRQGGPLALVDKQRGISGQFSGRSEALGDVAHCNLAEPHEAFTAGGTAEVPKQPRTSDGAVLSEGRPAARVHRRHTV
jgi:hypothetical protein